MSSILDALNKLEEEKARAQEEADTVELDVDQAVEELVGRSVFRDRVTLRFTPGKLLIGGGLFVIVLVAVSVGVSVAVLKSAMSSTTDAPVEALAKVELPPAVPGESSQEEAGPDTALETGDAAALSAEVAESIEDEAGVSAPDEAAVEAPAVTSPAPVEEPVSTGQSSESTPVEKQEVVVVAKSPAIEEPDAVKIESKPVEVAPVEPPEESVPDRVEVARAATTPIVNRPSRARPVEEAPEPAAPVSIFTLPRLSPADLERNGLDNFRINMLRPVSASNPYGFAMINRTKVFEGQVIPGTRLELYAVEEDGIGLQERGTRLRYFAPF